MSKTKFCCSKIPTAKVFIWRVIYSALTYQTLGPINLRKLKRIFSAQLLLALRAYDRQKLSLKTTICASWQLLNPFFISYQTKNKTKEFFLKIFAKRLIVSYSSSASFMTLAVIFYWTNLLEIFCVKHFEPCLFHFPWMQHIEKKTQKTNKFRLNSITLFLSVSFYWFSAIKYVDFLAGISIEVLNQEKSFLKNDVYLLPD